MLLTPTRLGSTALQLWSGSKDSEVGGGNLRGISVVMRSEGPAVIYLNGDQLREVA